MRGYELRLMYTDFKWMNSLKEVLIGFPGGVNERHKGKREAKEVPRLWHD